MAASIFARIGTIQGESHDAEHPGEIEVVSWAWGVSQSGTIVRGGGGGAGKASFQNFSFTHHVDRASPVLMQACATGRHIEDATTIVRKVGADQQEYLVVKMTDILVTSVATSVNAEGDAATEAVTLAFAKVDLEYIPQSPDGSLEVGVHFTFDLEQNK